MKVYYWSPHTSYVATIKAVYNSALSLTKYNKENFIQIPSLNFTLTFLIF